MLAWLHSRPVPGLRQAGRPLSAIAKCYNATRFSDFEELCKPRVSGTPLVVASARKLARQPATSRGWTYETALSLDPDIDSYYLMDAVVVKLPAVLERLGQIRARGTGILT